MTEAPHYHDTWTLLRKYRDVVWSLEVSVRQVRNRFRIDYGKTIEDFLESVYLAGADLSGTGLEHQAKCIEQSHKMLCLVDSAVDLMRAKHKNGEEFYWLLYYAYLSPQELQNVEEIIDQLLQKCSEMIAYQPIQRLIADRSIRTNGRSGFFIMRYFAIMRTSVPVPSRVRCWMRLRYPATEHSRRRMGSSPATQREECFPTRPTGGKTDGLHCSRTPADTSRSA